VLGPFTKTLHPNHRNRNSIFLWSYYGSCYGLHDYSFRASLESRLRQKRQFTRCRGRLLSVYYGVLYSRWISVGMLFCANFRSRSLVFLDAISWIIIYRVCGLWDFLIQSQPYIFVSLISSRWHHFRSLWSLFV